MSYNSRPCSANNKTRKKFYLTTLNPISFYSSKNNGVYNNTTQRTYTLNNSSSRLFHGNKQKFEKSIKNKIRPSLFYNNGKSLRIQDEIDWINHLIIRKSRMNKYINSNRNNYDIKDEEKENSELGRSKMRFNQINTINNDIDKIKFKEFKYNDSSFSHRENIYPLFIITKFKKNGIFSKTEIDNYNHKIFMKQMNNFKKSYGINKWKNDFKNKFKEY